MRGARHRLRPRRRRRRQELAEAGRDVILLEEGPPFGKKDFVQEAGESMHRTFREGGTRAARGNMFVPTMQAIALGGGSLVNSAICARSPAFVFDAWAERTGTRALTRAALDPHYDRVEKFLFVGPTPMDVQGERNLRFKRGCDALGISSEPTYRNVAGCKGSAECFTGCRNGAKQSTDVSYVPRRSAPGRGSSPASAPSTSSSPAAASPACAGTWSSPSR